MKELEQYKGKTYTEAMEALEAWAKSKGYTITIVPTDVDNIDVEPRRISVWVDLDTGKIKRFTRG